MARRALITGITGQDGSYLAEFLLEVCESNQCEFAHGFVKALERPLRSIVDQPVAVVSMWRMPDEALNFQQG